MFRALLVGGLVFFSAAAHAEMTFPNVSSCGLDFWTNIITVEDLTLEVPLEKIEWENKELISKTIKEKGLVQAYMMLHVAYANCIRKAGVDFDRPGSAQNDPYWRCAVQSFDRTGVLVGIAKGQTAAQQKASRSADYHDMIGVLYRHAEKSFLKAVVLSAQSAKDCIDRATEVRR